MSQIPLLTPVLQLAQMMSRVSVPLKLEWVLSPEVSYQIASLLC